MCNNHFGHYQSLPAKITISVFLIWPSSFHFWFIILPFIAHTVVYCIFEDLLFSRNLPGLFIGLSSLLFALHFPCPWLTDFHLDVYPDENIYNIFLCLGFVLKCHCTSRLAGLFKKNIFGLKQILLTYDKMLKLYHSACIITVEKNTVIKGSRLVVAENS